jgi:hypothetical protein
MNHVPFDPSKAVTFDLARGLIQQEGAPSGVIVPAESLAALARAAGPEASRAFGRGVGEAIGRRVARGLSEVDGVRAAGVAAVVEHLGGELAMTGLGSLGVERWGRALVLVVDQSPLGAGGDALLESVLAGALEAAVGERSAVIALAREGTRARFLVTGPSGADKVRAWLNEGISWGDALVRLHDPGTATTSRGDA